MNARRRALSVVCLMLLAAATGCGAQKWHALAVTVNLDATSPEGLLGCMISPASGASDGNLYFEDGREEFSTINETRSFDDMEYFGYRFYRRTSPHGPKAGEESGGHEATSTDLDNDIVRAYARRGGVRDEYIMVYLWSRIPLSVIPFRNGACVVIYDGTVPWEVPVGHRFAPGEYRFSMTTFGSSGNEKHEEAPE